jgi:hypothetical protein
MKTTALLAGVLLALAGCGEPDPPAAPAGTTTPQAVPVAPPAEAPPAAAPGAEPDDSPDALLALMEKLSAAAVAGRTDEALAMSRALLLPHPEAWFAETFGPEIGKRLTAEYAARAGQIDTLPGVFPGLRRRGQTELLVEQHEDPADPGATGYQGVAMAHMKRPVRLYSVRFLEPHRDAGFSLWSFVFAEGAFRFAGKMRAVDPAERSPEAAALGELRRADAEKILKPAEDDD